MESISPISEIICVIDEPAGLVQIYEEHARGTCRGAAAWTAHHYGRTSNIVLGSYRDGPRDVFTLKTGKGDLDLKPSFSPAGIESVSKIYEDGKDLIEVIYAGLGGAGVGITQCRKSAKGLYKAEILRDGGGGNLGRSRFLFEPRIKLHIGIDDTDSKNKGATWSLGNELGVSCVKAGISYINHTLVQLFPFAPGKTTNCVGTVLTFAVLPEMVDGFIEEFKAELQASTSSDQTGMAVFQGISIPKRLKDFSDLARSQEVSVQEAKSLKDLVNIYEITGSLGVIGAVGSLGYSERHEEAVRSAVDPENE